MAHRVHHVGCMWKKLLKGAAGGLAGTLAHSAVMLGARRLGLVGELPPKRITDEMLESLGADPGEDTRIALSVANHVAFGVATGTVFALLQPRMSRPMSIATGAAYGLGVWFTSYEGWVPHVLGAVPRAHRDRWDRQVALIAAHVVFGAVVGAFTARPRRVPERPPAEPLAVRRRRRARGTGVPDPIVVS